MFGLKPPLYYLPGKRVCAPPWVPRGAGMPRAPTPPDPPQPESAWWVRRASCRRARAAPAAPAAVQRALCVLRAAGSAHPSPPPPRRRRGLRVSLLLSARSWLRGGGAASGQSTQAFRGELSTGCEVTFLQADAIGWHATSPAPSLGAYFPLPPASPVSGLCASVARSPAPPLSARDSLEGSVPAEVGGGGRGSSEGWLAWLPVFLTLRADSSLPCNFLFRGKSRLLPKGEWRG